jgi:hypothetical protein
MSFGAWNVRTLHRSGSLTTLARELARYKLDLVGVQLVRWDKVSTIRTGDILKKETKIIVWEHNIFTPQNGVSS